MKFMVICIFAALLCFSAPLVAASADAVQAPEIDKDLVLYFNTIDASGDNSLSADELSVFFTKTFGHKVSANQLNQVISKLDANQDGAIQRQEFVAKYGAHFRPMLDIVPQQLHLALTGKASEMRITWVTKAVVTQPIVVYGPGAMNLYSFATTSTYDKGTFIPWIGWVHTAIMTGLSPDTTYYYQVGASGSPFSDMHSFKTQPFSPKPVTIALFGDMGTVMPFGFETSFQIYQDNHITPFDLVVHAGDIAYSGTGESWSFEFIWDIFGRQTESWASIIPYMLGVGNHEKYFNFTAFNTRYQMPSDTSGGYANFWMSFDHSFAHWTFMSTEHDYAPGSPQYNWLVQDFEKAVKNRKNVPWIFLVGHRPMFSSDLDGWGAHRPGAYFQSIIEPLLVKYGVDVYWSGHQHCYERTWPMINGTSVTYSNNRVYRNPGRPSYIVQGTAGAFIGEEWVEPRPSWIVLREQMYGYGRLSLFNATHMHYEYLTTNSWELRDDFWIIKQ